MRGLLGRVAAILVCCQTVVASDGVRVGAAAVNLKAEDSMEIAGGIHPGMVRGQEGELRAIAVVLEKAGVTLAIVTVDILMITRDILDPAVAAIEEATGIPGANVLINCTHTHHAPSTLRVHGYGADLGFTLRVQKGIVEAVKQAHAALSRDECAFHFHLGREETVGQNSRQLLPDGRIYWIGRRDFVRPTGPFDPELPVWAFRDRGTGEQPGALRAVLFNHSTHTIGTIEPGVRSPSFYGLAAQRLEDEFGGVFSFVEGASGSTHNLDLSCAEMTTRIATAVKDALARAEPRPVVRLAALKRPFSFAVRTFDEEKEDAAVRYYCDKWVGEHGAKVVPVFREMRRQLAPAQGEKRETWLQVMAIGDVAIAAVPAEFFTKLGLDIKNRSPFRHTYIAELANDWIGYLPDHDAHKLGGYQVWTGFHSFAEPGTGERVVDQTLALLHELHELHDAPPPPPR